MFGFFKKPKAAPRLEELKLPEVNKYLEEYLKQGELQPKLQDFANKLNTGYRESLDSAIPGLLDRLNRAGQTTDSYLRGEIPKDVRDAIIRGSVARSISGGYGPDSLMGRNLTSRDLGLTSMDLMGQGFARLGNELNWSQALTPAIAQNMIYDPGTIMQRRDNQALTNLNIRNQNKQIDFANSQRKSGFSRLLESTIGNIVSTPFNFLNNSLGVVQQIPQMAAGAAMSYLTPTPRFWGNNVGGVGGIGLGSSYGYFGQAPSAFGGSPLGLGSNFLGNMFNPTAPRALPYYY
jgi:hypothetical protein